MKLVMCAFLFYYYFFFRVRGICKLSANQSVDYYFLILYFSRLPIPISHSFIQPFHTNERQWQSWNTKYFLLFRLYYSVCDTSSFAQTILKHFSLLSNGTFQYRHHFRLFLKNYFLLYMKNANSDVLHYYVTRKRFCNTCFFPLLKSYLLFTFTFIYLYSSY